MTFLSHPVAARALWLAPLLLLAIAAGLLRAGLAQRDVAREGVRVMATVDSMAVRERSEITRGAAYFRYTPPGETAEVVRAVELPMSFIKELEEVEGQQVPILVRGATGQIVLGTHARAQWVLTLSFAAMALIGALGVGALVRGWNRLLAREGDPATRPA